MAEPTTDPTQRHDAGDGATEPAGSDAAPHWRDAISDERLRQFAERFTSPAEIARAALDLRQKLSNAVVLPGRDADLGDVLEFRRKLGVPDAPEHYAFAAAGNDGAEAADGAFRAAAAKAFHGAGVTAEQAEALTAWWNSYAGDARLQSRREAESRRARSEAALRRDWGGDYDRNLEIAARAARAYGGGALEELLNAALADGSRVGDQPAMMKAFAEIGRNLVEDDFHAGAAGTPSKTARERIDELTRLMFDDPAAYRTDAVQGELKTLYDRMTGGAPLVGTDGRRR